MWIHAWRIGQLSRWLDSARNESDDENDESLESEGESDEPVEEESEVVVDEPDLDIPPPVTEDEEIELVDLD